MLCISITSVLLCLRPRLVHIKWWLKKPVRRSIGWKQWRARCTGSAVPWNPSSVTSALTNDSGWSQSPADSLPLLQLQVPLLFLANLLAPQSTLTSSVLTGTTPSKHKDIWMELAPFPSSSGPDLAINMDELAASSIATLNVSVVPETPQGSQQV